MNLIAEVAIVLLNLSVVVNSGFRIIYFVLQINFTGITASIGAEVDLITANEFPFCNRVFG